MYMRLTVHHDFWNDSCLVGPRRSPPLCIPMNATMYYCIVEFKEKMRETIAKAIQEDHSDKRSPEDTGTGLRKTVKVQ